MADGVESWLDLLFAHWRVNAERLSRVLPPRLEPEIINGSAWIGITPFEVRALRLRLTLRRRSSQPSPSSTSAPTSPSTASRASTSSASTRRAVSQSRRRAAHTRFPYFHAHMSVRRQGETVDYSSERLPSSGPPASFRATYGPRGNSYNAAPDSLDWKPSATAPTRWTTRDESCGPRSTTGRGSCAAPRPRSSRTR